MNEVFEKTLRDWASWDYWTQMISAQEGLDPDAKEAALRGLSELRRLLGESWLGDAVRDRHPILNTLINSAPWTRFWIGDFARKLHDLEEMPGFAYLLVRLERAGEYEGALAELYIAWRLHVKGLRIELSSEVEGRAPDILIRGDPPVYVEVAVPRPSHERQKADRVMMNLGIFSLHQDPGVLTGGQIHHVLPERLMAKFQRQIKEAIDRVKATGEPVEIHDPGVVDFYLVPKANQELIAQWTSEGKVNQVLGPQIHTSEIFRLVRMLGEKIRQLPNDGAGIVVLYDTYASIETPRKIIVAELDEAIYRHPKITTAVIVTRNLATSLAEKVIVEETEFGLVLSQPVDRFFREELLVVNNSAAQYRLGSEQLLRLFRADVVASDEFGPRKN
jgi:hypothetical protein